MGLISEQTQKIEHLETKLHQKMQSKKENSNLQSRSSQMIISLNKDNRKRDEKFDQDHDHEQDRLRLRQESEIVLISDASAEFQTMQSEEALFEHNNNLGGQNNNTSSCQDSNIIILSKSSHTENKLGVGQYK